MGRNLTGGLDDSNGYFLFIEEILYNIEEIYDL